MEVHHHPHVEKKSFKEYLLEGLMIFIAVSMGFIAENIREKISEHEIEKRSMELIVDGLRGDTMQIKRVIGLNVKRIGLLDSILSFQSQNLNDPNVFHRFDAIFRKAVSSYVTLSNDAAYEAMKNSGSLRFIKKKVIVDGLFNYGYNNSWTKYSAESYNGATNSFVGSAAAFFNFNSVVQHIEHKDGDNKSLKFYNDALALKFIIENYYLSSLNTQSESAVKLIKLIQNEYHLENE